MASESGIDNAFHHQKRRALELLGGFEFHAGEILGFSFDFDREARDLIAAPQFHGVHVPGDRTGAVPRYVPA